MDHELKIYLEQNNLITKRSIYSPIESTDLTDFPELSLDELREITMGVYQMKQATCYTNEHLTEDALYELLLFKQAMGIIKEKIQSQHSKYVTHSMDSISERSSQTYRLVLKTKELTLLIPLHMVLPYI